MIQYREYFRGIMELAKGDITSADGRNKTNLENKISNGIDKKS